MGYLIGDQALIASRSHANQAFAGIWPPAAYTGLTV